MTKGEEEGLRHERLLQRMGPRRRSPSRVITAASNAIRGALDQKLEPRAVVRDPDR